MVAAAAVRPANERAGFSVRPDVFCIRDRKGPRPGRIMRRLGGCVKGPPGPTFSFVRAKLRGLCPAGAAPERPPNVIASVNVWPDEGRGVVDAGGCESERDAEGNAKGAWHERREMDCGPASGNRRRIDRVAPSARTCQEARCMGLQGSVASSEGLGPVPPTARTLLKGSSVWAPAPWAVRSRPWMT